MASKECEPVVDCTPRKSHDVVESQHDVKASDTTPCLNQCLHKTTPKAQSPKPQGRRSRFLRSRTPPPREPPPKAVWVQGYLYNLDEYSAAARMRPVWSVVLPTPCIVRQGEWKPADVHSRKPPRQSAEDRAELGEAGIHAQESSEGTATRPRTAAGAGHCCGCNCNGARRPVSDAELLGEQADGDADPEGEGPTKPRNWWARQRVKHREPLAEFLATGTSCFLGLASTLSVNLSSNQDKKYGTYDTTCWAWGIAWMFGMWLAYDISGAHMNPAVSISLSLFRKFPGRLCVIYVFVQLIAAIVAGALAFGIYKDTIRHINPTMTNTAKTFFSSPQEWVSMGTACFDQVVGSAIMMIAVCALSDLRNREHGTGTQILLLGLLCTSLKFALGYNTGSALNPASDFGPRVVAWAVGYRGEEVWETGWWLFGPWLSTVGGSIIGCIVYDIFVFVGAESPINWHVPDYIKKRARRMTRTETEK